MGGYSLLMTSSPEVLALTTALDRHRALLAATADGLTEEQIRLSSTVSSLTIGSLLKHVADTEEQWLQFAQRGPAAFPSFENVDWSAIDPTAPDPRFVLTDEDTVESLQARVLSVGARTRLLLNELDLDREHPLPAAPWFEPGAAWSVRRVALHLLAEISQHAGHADIIREAIDGAQSMATVSDSASL
jgi:hypothetical protein